MNIVFITMAYPNSSEEYNLYTDLMDEFIDHGHSVYVACCTEKRYGENTSITNIKRITVLRIKTGNLTSNPNYISKGIELLKFQYLYLNAIKKYFKEISFDLIIYSTPPIQYYKIIKHLKNKSNALTYLMLKDIFPQNAVDMGLLTKWNPIYWHFRFQEIKTYTISDFIGCMSKANVKYVIDNNRYLSQVKVEICTNSLKDRGKINEQDRILSRKRIRNKLKISNNELLLVYGGNIGISQGIPFLIELFKFYKDTSNIKFLIVGKGGTWLDKIYKTIDLKLYKNVILHKRIPPADFKEMLLASDIGLIFLNPKFTIPNFPSRLTSYLEVGLPVIACTDKVSDVGDIIEQAECGFKIISGDLKEFDTVLQHLIANNKQLSAMSENARKLFEQSYTTQCTYSTIMNHLNNY